MDCLIKSWSNEIPQCFLLISIYGGDLYADLIYDVIRNRLVSISDHGGLFLMPIFCHGSPDCP